MSQNLRIAFLESSPAGGGGQRNLVSILERLDRTRFVPFVLCPEDGPFTEALRTLGLSPTIFDMGRLHQRYLWDFYPRRRKLAAWLKENRIQLVVANSFPAGKLGFRAARDAGIPTILYKQIIIHKGRFSSTAFLYRYYLKDCDRIIAVSGTCRLGLLHIGIPDKKIAVIPNGVDTEKWKPCLDGIGFRKLFGLEEAMPLVGCVAVLRMEKGIEDLLRAWAHVTKNQPRAILAIVGEAEPTQKAYGESLRALCRSLEITATVVFCGFLEDLHQAYGAFDLFVSSSYSEAFGLSLATAMACGKPVISTRSGGPEEIIEDGISGCLCAVGDPRALARVILDMLAEGEKWKIMGRAARERIADRFSLDRQVRSLEKLFTEVAGN